MASKPQPHEPVTNLFGEVEPAPAQAKANKTPAKKIVPAKAPAPFTGTFLHVAEVAVERPMRQTFTFIADDVMDRCAVGARVEVQFGKGTTPGFVIAMGSADDFRAQGFDASKLKRIVAVLDNQGEPSITQPLLKLAQWMSAHYVCPLGMTLKSMLPSGVKIGTESRKTRFVETHLSANELMIHASALATKKKSQSAILRALAGRDLSTTIDATQLLEESQSTATALKALEKSKFLRVIELSEDQLHATSAGPKRSVNLTLNAEQQAAFEQIEAALLSNEATGFLLQGVTGSGKTEVYLRALQSALDAGKQALVLVPEIALTPQTAERFESRLGRDRVAVLASDMAPGRRAEVWRKIRAGKIDVVLGARSVLYAPLPRLGIIVVDEEHDTSYKSQAAPRYHARDAALALARVTQSTVILGSATPCFESCHAADSGRLTRLVLNNRATGAPMPPVEIVDLNAENQENNRYTFISRRLIDALSRTLSRGEQAILFLNRRGFATVNKCLRCGQTEKCSACDIALTSHQNTNELVCHYCNRRKPISNVCGNCGAPGLKNWGLGTERVEEAVKKIFLSARIARMDSDTMNKTEHYEDALGAFKARQTDILIGTQMIAKGLDFPAVTLVGVLLADTALHMPDFRNRERTFQLLSQVSGRAGRGELGGRVIVQTFLPGDSAIKFAAKHDFESFYLEEIKERKMFDYPPYAGLTRIVLSGPNHRALLEGSETLAGVLKRTVEHDTALRGVQILGPSEPPITRIRNEFRRHILIKTPGPEMCTRLLDGTFHNCVAAIARAPAFLKTLIDVDAISML